MAWSEYSHHTRLGGSEIAQFLLATRSMVTKNDASCILFVFCKPILAMFLQRGLYAPKRRFRKTEQKIGRVSAFWKHFSRMWAHDLGYYSLNGLFERPKSSFGEHKQMFVVFCKPILAMLLQRNHPTIIHASCILLCLVNPSLQCCYKASVWFIACTSHATIVCNHVCKVVTKDHSIPEKQHIASHHRTCDNLL